MTVENCLTTARKTIDKLSSSTEAIKDLPCDEWFVKSVCKGTETLTKISCDDVQVMFDTYTKSFKLIIDITDKA